MDGDEKEKRSKKEPWGPWMGEDREKEEDLETRVWPGRRVVWGALSTPAGRSLGNGGRRKQGKIQWKP